MKKFVHLTFVILLAVAGRESLLATTLTDGLVAYYPLNGSAADVSGHGLDGSVHGATLVADRFGNSNCAYNFDGLSAYIECPNLLPNFQTAGTMACWIKPSETSKEQAALSQERAFGDMCAIRLGVWNGQADGGFNNDPSHGNWGVDNFCVFSGTSIAANTWHHVAVTVDGQVYRLYYDGVLRGQHSYTNNGATTGKEFQMGRDGNVPSVDGFTWRYYSGGIDDVRVYNRTLSSTEIQQLYASESGQAQGAPAILTDPISQSVNWGSPVTFTVSGSGESLAYQWRKNEVAISSATTSSLTIASAQTSDAGIYDVVLTNPAGTATSKSASLEVVNPAITSQPLSQLAFPNTVATFSVTAVGDGPLKYQWRRNGKKIQGATSATCQVIANGRNVGNYDVVVSNLYGVRLSETATLSLRPPVEVELPPCATRVQPGGNATFSVDASGPGAVTYQWKKNGKAIVGATSSSLTINQATAADAGVYTCVLTSSSGKVTTESALLIYDDPRVVVYKLSGRGALSEGVTSSDTDVSGYLVFDRSKQKVGLVWIGVSGTQNLYSTELREDLAVYSTGPVPKSTTVVASNDQQGGAVAWLKGTDALAEITATDSTIAPLTLAGFLNQVHLVDHTQIQSLNLSLALDRDQSAASRLGQESLEDALTRIGNELQAKGYSAQQQ